MKRTILLLSAILVSATAVCQQYSPRETWPFLYEHFHKGCTRTMDDTLISESLFNITAKDGKLVYLGQGNIIMVPNMSRVYAARIENDVYANIGGRMYLVLSETEDGMVVLWMDVDEDALNKSDIGYGKSSVASTQKLSTLAIDGGSMTNRSLDSFTNDKYSGKELPMKSTYYLYVNNQLVRATKGDVMKVSGVDGKAAKEFFKQEKIKWKDVASLEKVLEFISSQIKE
ncbi:MAG: hypothetical protein IKX67_08530 [Bacteroidales bacterium]|nr:hypothetical protein [Bacteroidales bacterium]